MDPSCGHFRAGVRRGFIRGASYRAVKASTRGASIEVLAVLSNHDSMALLIANEPLARTLANAARAACDQYIRPRSACGAQLVHGSRDPLFHAGFAAATAATPEREIGPYTVRHGMQPPRLRQEGFQRTHASHDGAEGNRGSR
jgi:hypothetical protein